MGGVIFLENRHAGCLLTVSLDDARALRLGMDANAVGDQFERTADIAAAFSFRQMGEAKPGDFVGWR